jgi:hypothetical protein
MPNNLYMHVESVGSSNLYEQRRRINECARVCFSRDLMQIASAAAAERYRKRGKRKRNWLFPTEFSLSRNQGIKMAIENRS